jgi:hypothetical protein
MFGIQFSPFQASDLCTHQRGAVLEVFRTVRCPRVPLAVPPMAASSTWAKRAAPGMV